MNESIANMLDYVNENKTDNHRISLSFNIVLETGATHT